MLIQGEKLFPLEWVGGTYTGYYMDSNGEVWSTKKGDLRKLAGTSPSRYNNYTKYFTLNGISVQAQWLRRCAEAHKDFDRETGKGTISAQNIGVDLAKVAAAQAAAGSVHAANVAEGVKGKGYIIATIQGDQLLFASRPAIHLTEASYKAEMERLAKAHPGTEFVGVKVLNSVQVPAVYAPIWK